MTWRLFCRLERLAISREPDYVIGKAGEPYLERWYVIPRNPLFNIYLHHFLRSDDDRALHDHMYVNASILLCGRYVEHTIEAGGWHRRITYRAGDIKLRRAKSAHRIELDRGPCWSLFITGPRIRNWGFWCVDKGWRPWQDFVDERDHGKIGRGCE